MDPDPGLAMVLLLAVLVAVLAVVPQRRSAVCCASVVVAPMPQLVCLGASVRIVRFFDLFFKTQRRRVLDL
eukprot:3865427-Alexandrium_andersonii.AAC.1